MGRNDDDCPWFPDGKHRDGCGCHGGAPSRKEANRRGRQAQAFAGQQERVNASMKKKADDYVRKFRNTRFTTYTPAGTGNLPPGVHMEPDEQKGEKVYRVVLD